MSQRQMSAEALGNTAGISPNTVRTFLAGESWPVVATLGKIEAALDWPAGRIEDLALGYATTRSASEDVVALPADLNDLPAPIEIVIDGVTVTVQMTAEGTEDQAWETAHLILEAARARRKQQTERGVTGDA